MNQDQQTDKSQSDQFPSPSSRKEGNSAGLSRRQLNYFIGGGLIGFGFLMMVGLILFSVSLGRYLWPFNILVPGIVGFMIALNTRKSYWEPLLIVSSIICMVGLLLFYQNVTGHWASWAYAWALIAPTSIGLGRAIYGSHHGQENLFRDGMRLARIGGMIFLVGLVFFEGILHISRFGRVGGALVMIVVGVLLLMRHFMRSE